MGRSATGSTRARRRGARRGPGPDPRAASRSASKRRPAGKPPATRHGAPRSSAERTYPGRRRGRTLRSGRPRRKRAPISWRARLAIGVAVVLAAGAGYLFWLRDSSLVAIDDVDVVGVTSGDRERIVDELTATAEGMTTLHVDRERIEAVAARFPTIGSVGIDPNFAHGMRIEVTERPPALIMRSGDGEVAVAGDGTVLAGVPVPDDADLPVIEGDEPPGGKRLEGDALQQALVAGAVPEPLRPLVETLEISKDYGIEVVMRGGIPVRFGTGARATEKWAAAAAVLADPKLDSLSYLDVRVPERPAAGGAA